ncbi:MAG: DUF3393 domain-containing protein [candidate division Zixibacteria bacterium]|nr:DUF3393 domain-containing protein [candidate division Zixibacteria bacterium]
MLGEKRNRILLAGLLFSIFTIPMYIALSTSKAQQTFEEYKNQQDKEYANYLKEENEAFEKYVREVEAKWIEFQNSTKRDWFEYSHDLNTLSHVDFEKGKIIIETLVEQSAGDPMERASRNIKDKIAGLFEVDSLTHDVILENQVEFNSPPIIDSTNARLFAREKVLSTAEIQKETVKSSDGIERVKVTATIEMVPDHIRLRAEKYLPVVRKYCAKYKLEIPLVMAIMETESFFNPRAKSPVPAFGLMQLVPRSGAREAYRFVHKEDKIVKANYLYTPENNIHLGCAYLAKMRDYEFKSIKDINKIRLCLIAAYNTGPGNVCKAIVGERKLKPAMTEINDMDSDELFEVLKDDLPFKETRDYLVKVESRRGNYAQWN